MRIISSTLIILSCSLNFCFLAIVTGGEPELSNDINLDQEPAVAEDLELTTGEIKSVSEDPKKTQNTENVVSDSKLGNLSLEQRFDNGVEAYLNENWESCVDEFETAIESYKKYKESLIECRRKCRAVANAAKPIFTEDVEDFHFYERKVKETLCLMECKKMMHTEDIKTKLVPDHVELKYIERRPYEYLHICYYQMKRNQDAANAIFTFLAFRPDHKQNLENLRFYLKLPDVDEDKVVDLESDPFLEMYKAGIVAYNDENYPEVIEKLENSIKSYIKAENNCRFYCEGPFDQGWLPDFVMSIANHFAFSLKCKRSCAIWLNNVNGEQREDVLMNHYHYLQFAYFQVGEMKNACAAVESYLQFIPNDETMIRNKKYLLGLPDVKEEYFEPREEVVPYVRRQEYELRIQLYIQEEFANSIKNPTQ